TNERPRSQIPTITCGARQTSTTPPNPRRRGTPLGTAVGCARPDRLPPHGHHGLARGRRGPEHVVVVITGYLSSADAGALLAPAAQGAKGEALLRMEER